MKGLNTTSETVNHLVVIAGPTAIGKTALSVAVAKALHTEIISADARQFYREMSIGTAVPGQAERRAVPHHFVQHISIGQDYGVGDFEQEALHELNSLFQSHRQVVMVGGSGLYIDAVCSGLNRFPKVDPQIRETLNKQFHTEGIAALQAQLKELDPDYYKQVDLHNHRRLIRALEVCIGSQKPYSYFIGQPKTERPFSILKTGLRAPREILYSRIEQRVDQMMENGLLEEAERLYAQREHNALNTIGYKELFLYLNGAYPLDFAILEIKKNTRRFAKRQLTWFQKDPDINWFDYRTPASEIIRFIREKTGA